MKTTLRARSTRPPGLRSVSLLVVMAVILVAIGGVLGVRLLLAEAEENRESLATATAERVVGDLRVAIARAREVASATARQPAITAIANGDRDPTLRRALTDATSRISDESVASVIGEDGKELARALGDKVFEDQEMVREARNFVGVAGGLNAVEGFTVLVGPSTSPDTDLTVISAAARVLGSGAVLQIEVPLDEVLELAAAPGATLVDRETGDRIAGAEPRSTPFVVLSVPIEGASWDLRVDVATAAAGRDASSSTTTLILILVASLALLMVIITLAMQQRSLWHASRVDSGTGLANRRQLADAIENEVRRGEPVTLLVFSLIRFRRVVEVLGHAHGDRMLVEVSRRLRRAAPREAILARSSEEELAVVLVGEQWVDDAETLAEDLRLAMTAGLIVDGVPIDLGARVGLAMSPEHARDAPALLRRAVSALRAAAVSGKDVLVYDPELDLDGRHQLTLAGELEHAIQDGAIDIELQPKLSLRSGKVVGLEALARWRRPSGDISPVDFIPLAEATGRIAQLTMHVMDRALDERARLAAVGYDVNVAVNLSAVSLSDPDVAEAIHALLQRHETQPSRLVLELTETSIMADPELAVRTLTRLRALGVKISVDDFGTGYSAMAYLTQLPVDEVKIDRSFVSDGGDDLRVVRSVIRLAHDFNLSVVAEGVESATVLERLRELDCDEAQGYHIARPMGGRELRAWLANRSEEWVPATDGSTVTTG